MQPAGLGLHHDTPAAFSSEYRRVHGDIRLDDDRRTKAGSRSKDATCNTRMLGTSQAQASYPLSRPQGFGPDQSQVPIPSFSQCSHQQHPVLGFGQNGKNVPAEDLSTLQTYARHVQDRYMTGQGYRYPSDQSFDPRTAVAPDC